jgi:FkbM family methyltransferase
MPDVTATESAVMRLARRTGAALPFARSLIVRGTARICGVHKLVAEVEPGMHVEVDFHERMSRHLYMFGNIEPVVRQVFFGILHPGDTVLDVGANFGYFTLLAARSVGGSGRIIAFEPDPRNVARLKRNIALNSASQVEVVEIGVFDQQGSLTFHLAGEAEDNMGTSSLLDKGPQEAGRKTVEIPVTTLDTFIAQRGITRIDLLKMDIEGAEWGAIRGGLQTLKGGIVKQVLIEVHTGILGHDKSAEVLNMLQDCGFTGFAINEDKDHVADWKGYLDPVGTKLELLNPHYLFVRNGQLPGQ